MLIAVTGAVLITDNLTAQAIITTPASTKIFAESKGVYKGTIDMTVTGATQGTYLQVTPANTTLTGTATKVFAESSLVVLEGDQSVPAQCSITNTVSPFDTIIIPVTVTIQSAGQTKVEAT